jgi:hypothetical protein
MKVFHFLPANYALDAIENQRLKASQLDDLNDPFELYAVELSDSKRRAEFRSFKRDMAKNTALLCFSKSWRNPLLWSHYADKHKGVALEIEVLDNLINEVSYQPNRLILDIDRKLAAKGLNEKDVYRLLTTKFKHWEYEEEVRVFLRKSECTLERDMFFYGFDGGIKITGLVHGPLCNITEGEIAKRLPSSMTISIVKGRLAFKTFSVVQSRSVGKRSIYGKA